MGGDFGEDGFDAVHIEFGGSVVIVNAVLLLLYVGELGVAVARHVGDRVDCINLTFKTVVEFIKRFGSFAVAPGVVGKLLAYYPFYATEFIDEEGLT